MFTPDSSQQQIINISQGQHLVLAPPGCGKTQILSERIRIAHSEHGVPYGDMLCLTFTNRAARGMAERISQTISDSDIADLFVGNIHRYCIRILTNHELVPSNTSIIDDDDALSILSRLSNQDEELVIADFKKTHDLFDCIHFSQMMHQINKNHPKGIRLHPECLNKDDLNAMRIVCTAYRKVFTAETMNDMYEHADFYLTDIDHLQTGTYANYAAYRQQVRNTLTKLSLAHQYETYKRDHNLMDFNEVLLRAYDAISEAKTSNEPDKQAFLEAIQRPWIQVDEVQDLNPLQMAIIDLISKNECILYLGDEQQAIFSFMGAKLSTLEMLRERCTPVSDNEKAVKGIHHLAKNHRSPRYLLDIYNRYAEKVLGIDAAFLPQPTNNDQATDATRFIYANTTDDEVEKVARQAGEWLKQNPEETTAIVTLSNADADEISHQLTHYSLPHFKISGTDLFSTPDMKLLLAHFTAVQSDTNLIAWSRIMQGAKCIHTAYEARDIVHQLIATGISPSELMTSGTPPLTQQFVKAYETQDIVIFDTETTGLDTFRDDIIQIAAMRIRGEKVLGQFMVHIETDREIPAMLGDIVNPIIEERKTAEILSHEDALTRFADFAKDAVLLAHNADFDINILHSNINRYSKAVLESAPSLLGMAGGEAAYFDSLRLIRLLEPDLRVHKLKHLLETLHLEGQNSHLADDDVYATKSLVDYCYKKAKAIIPHQNALLAREAVINVGAKLQKNYAPLYHHTHDLLYKETLSPLSLHRERAGEPQNPTTSESLCAKENPPMQGDSGGLSVFTTELRYIHDALVSDKLIQPVEKLDYICSYIDNDLIDAQKYPELILQLQHYGAEINTLREADLCNSSRIKERIYVSTVHKAKGLEFDNVIVFDAVDGRYPNFNATTINQKEEDARKLYVALSRAKKRLYIGISEKFINRYGRTFDRTITPFLKPVMDKFS